MKRLSKLCLGLGIVCLGIALIGCHEAPIGDDFADTQYAPEGALIVPSKIQVGFFDLADPDNSQIGFDLASKGEGVSSTEVLVSFNGQGQSAYTTLSALPATVTVSLDQVLAALGMTIDQVEVGDAVRFSFRATTSTGVYLSNRTVRIPFSCKSDLKGEVDYVTTNHFCGSGPLTGTTMLNETGAGKYSFTNWAFGTYEECYGGTQATWGSLAMNDVCNKISVTGVDAFGDSWEVIINSVSGADLSITWSNTYGEFGTTVLTRTDGRNWPALTN